MAQYSFLDRVLHRLALQWVPVAELSFELDQKLVTSDPKEIVGERHIFVSGLARAGTTILMRRFHATGAFLSLTYREMPFILAPNFWRKLGSFSQRDVIAAERAHGDGVLVDIDSPESLDEVFWRIFCGEEYIEESQLVPHSPEPDVIWKYVRYINAILNTQDRKVTRYISKNNNNILRLNSIRRAFPQALILIPFRDPLTHSGSLLRMHRNFVGVQKEDRFARSYMTWLVHHEFGLTHRPFRFSPIGSDRTYLHDPDKFDYWLDMWLRTYEWLDEIAPDGAVFVCYEDLCTDEKVWDSLASIAQVSPSLEELETFSLSTNSEGEPVDRELLERASTLYARLVDRARAVL